MKITSLNTKKAAERGAAMHLRHPVFGHKLYVGDGAFWDEDNAFDERNGQWIDPDKDAQPVLVFVQGVESDSVKARAKKVQSRAMKGEGEALDDDALALVSALVTGFSGILNADGEPLTDSTEDKKFFFEQSEDFVVQVTEFATNRANFFKAS